MTLAVDTPAPGVSLAGPKQSVPAGALLVGTGRAADLIGPLLAANGEDSARGGLAGTPARVAGRYRDFLSPAPSAAATCVTGTHLSGRLVLAGDISLWSL